tara:strand:+ start:1004 stop:1543 length:540 start_codon:yes stop_codon:yes gene_type:complete
MAKITLNGVDALTESGGTVTVAAGTNLVLGTDAVPTAAIQDDAVTSAKLDTNIAVAGTLGATGATTLGSTLAVTGATTLSSTLAVTGNATFTGDITVNGTTTTVNSTTVTIDDKNMELGSVASPSDTTADGGGITLKGTTDKSILYEKDTKSWDFNQKIITRSGEAYMKSLHRSWVMGG